jgi:signal transduction histidine kinase
MGWAETTHAVLGPTRAASRSARRERAKDVAPAAAHELREIVATMNHELRTPLTCIHGALGLLEMLPQDELSPKGRQVLEIARRNSARLLRLVDGMLELERIESDSDALEIRAADVGELLREARDLNEPYATERGVELVLLPADGSRIRIDTDRFLQVLTNLISNAVKFSPAGGCVRLAAAAHGDCVRIAVSDQGPGIPEAFRSHVFERFARARVEAGPPGTGLGLSITKALVTRMAGRIWFETAEGAGTTFFVDVPACPS